MRDALCVVLTLAFYLLIMHVIFSWVPRPPEPIAPLVRFVRRVVDPVLSPLRRILPPLPLGGVSLDLSVLVAFILIALLRNAARCHGFFSL